MTNVGTIAGLGALIGDPARASMLVALLGGGALTARELADRAGVAPQTASGHLSRLLAAGVIAVERHGRYRYHRLASPDVAELLEAMHVAGSRIAGRRPGPVDPALRAARSCYDHIAGALGVALASALSAPGGEPGTALSRAGEDRLGDWGIDLGALRGLRRPFCRACLDWSERRPHLAGAVGAAILATGLDRGWLHRTAGSRALIVTSPGERAFGRLLG